MAFFKGFDSGIVSGRFEGITKLPGNLLDGLEGAEVVPNLKEKELLELDGKKLQIRQVGVNEDPPDPELRAWPFPFRHSF